MSRVSELISCRRPVAGGQTLQCRVKPLFAGIKGRLWPRQGCRALQIARAIALLFRPKDVFCCAAKCTRLAAAVRAVSSLLPERFYDAP